MEVCIVEACSVKVCSVEVCSVEVCSVEVCSVEVCSVEVCSVVEVTTFSIPLTVGVWVTIALIGLGAFIGFCSTSCD